MDRPRVFVEFENIKYQNQDLESSFKGVIAQNKYLISNDVNFKNICGLSLISKTS